MTISEIGVSCVADSTVTPLVDTGLGNTAYLVDLGDGRALAVDPSRDLRTLRAAARQRHLRVAYTAETHLHADFISGSRQLAADGAEVLGSAGGRREFGHRGLADGDEVDLGSVTLRALATPGHTGEHLAFLLLDGTSPIGIFTGGSLLVGAAARTDLVSPEQTEPLARAQYRSLQLLLTLPDDTAVLPTHGAGSFCSAPAGGSRTTTIGRERATNPLLAATSEDEFVRLLVDSMGSYPRYFDRLAEVNRRGPAVIDGDPVLAALPADRVRALLTAGGELVDVRPAVEFATAHIPGALSIPLRDAFATWLGWLVEPDRQLVIVRNPDQDPAEVTWQALKVGYERIAGELAGGMTTWQATGLPIRSIGLLAPTELKPAQVLDVRQDSEWRGGHLPQARQIELGGLPTRANGLPAGPITTMCEHGERAMTAASVLARAGRTELGVLVGAGPDEWAELTGGVLVTGG
jgi:glyoxylase-like metal-dependent hydrolase (beta-lactamase superfamily II)/rhodanese-related sulfurtransferase